MRISPVFTVFPSEVRKIIPCAQGKRHPKKTASAIFTRIIAHFYGKNNENRLYFHFFYTK